MDVAAQFAEPPGDAPASAPPSPADELPGDPRETSWTSEPSPGLGVPSGPGFAAWRSQPPPTTPHQPAGAPVQPRVASPPPQVVRVSPARPWLRAAIVTLAVLLSAGIGALVLVATTRTPRSALQTYTSTTAPAVRVSTTTSSIDISSPRGAGRLTVVSHSWRRTGQSTSAATRLHVEVQLVCRSGRLDYDPYFFQAFDARGRLFEVADARADGALGHGALGPGQRVHGVLVFALPRGDVTLLMTDDATQTMTALRIPG